MASKSLRSTLLSKDPPRCKGVEWIVNSWLAKLKKKKKNSK